MSHNVSMSSPKSGSTDGVSTNQSSGMIKDYLSPETKHLKKIRSMEQRGRIELIMGPMFAGKSTELLRRVRRF